MDADPSSAVSGEGPIRRVLVNLSSGRGLALDAISSVTSPASEAPRGLAPPATAALPRTAPAISADLAKRCREMAIRAHPYEQPGAGTGHAQEEREYFRQCVAKNGKMDQ